MTKRKELCMGPDERTTVDSVFQDTSSPQVSILVYLTRAPAKVVLLVWWREVLKSKTFEKEEKNSD